MRWEFTLPIDLLSPNQAAKGRGTTPGMRWRYTRHRDTAVNAVNVMRMALRIPLAPGKRLVRITRILGPRQRAFDWDNCAASCKALIDALKLVGLIRDDNDRWLEISVEQDDTQRANGPAVAVVLEEA